MHRQTHLADGDVRSHQPHLQHSGLVQRVSELLDRAGQKPPRHELERLSFWAANVLPMDSHKRLQLLEITSTPERLQKVRDEYISFQAGGLSCAIM